MSSSEDYLDGLLNSINKAKTDATQVEEKVETAQQKIIDTRKAISPDDDFFAATGIDSKSVNRKSSHPYLRKVLSEEDFLRRFEEELDMDDPDVFISEFEQEIDEEERIFQETGEVPQSENVVDALLDNIENAVVDATQKLDEAPKAEPEATAELEPEPEPEADVLPEATEETTEETTEEPETVSEGGEMDLSSDEPLSLPEDDDIDLSEFLQEDDEGEKTEPQEEADDDDFGFSLDDATSDIEEEPLDDSLKEFMPDEMDALDEVEFGDGEEPNLSGEDDLDLENILDGEDEDLLDIQSLLNGDEEGASEGADIDESAEANTEDDSSADGGKKGKKKKEKKKKEKGEKKPNPFVQKLLLLIFGPPDEDELAEMEANKNPPVTYDEEGNPITPEDPKEKKKREKEEKKAAKEAAKKEKEAAKKEKAAAKKEKPKKEPKPKKPKKVKEPDNSPKIPISIILTFLVLSISIIAVVMVGMTFTGLKRAMSQAQELYAEGDYIAAYEKLNGYPLEDEEVTLMRNQARTLADLQQCQTEYETFILYKQYNYALDSLIKGIGRYEKFKDDAAEYGIADQYDAYGDTLTQELQDDFGLTPEQALEIYDQPNRHYYTIELRKVLRSLGLPDL